jgi:hypothetical protein
MRILHCASAVGLWALANLKMLLLAIASSTAIYMAASNIQTAILEKAPTKLPTERFGAEYRGQRWLSVTGRAVIEYRDVVVSHNKYHEGKDLVYVYVPIVPADWQPQETVHVVGTYGPMPHRDVESWAASIANQPQPYTLTGMTGPFGPMRYWDMFPSLHFEEPVVYVNAGQSPDSPEGMLVFLGLMLVVFFVSAWRLGRSLRRKQV